MVSTNELLDRIRRCAKKGAAKPKRAQDMHNRILEELAHAAGAGVNDPVLNVAALAEIIADAAQAPPENTDTGFMQAAVDVVNALAAWNCLGQVEIAGPVTTDGRGRIALATVDAALESKQGGPTAGVFGSLVKGAPDGDPPIDNPDALLAWLDERVEYDEDLPDEIPPFYLGQVRQRPDGAEFEGAGEGFVLTLEIEGAQGRLTATWDARNPVAICAMPPYRMTWLVRTDEDQANAVKGSCVRGRRIDWALRRIRAAVEKGGA